jgi:hypothetical protein
LKPFEWFWYALLMCSLNYNMQILPKVIKSNWPNG